MQTLMNFNCTNLMSSHMNNRSCEVGRKENTFSIPIQSHKHTYYFAHFAPIYCGKSAQCLWSIAMLHGTPHHTTFCSRATKCVSPTILCGGKEKLFIKCPKVLLPNIRPLFHHTLWRAQNNLYGPHLNVLSNVLMKKSLDITWRYPATVPQRHCIITTQEGTP